MITVGDVVREPSLRARVVAGSAGLERVVTWAATCEMDNPWEWLDAGDLLLVNGHRVPETAQGQTEFIQHLDTSGMAGLGIAERAFSPDLSPSMLRTADELSFPLLRLDYEVSFTTIAKTVARWNQDTDQSSIRLTARVYDWFRRGSARGHELPTVLETIGEALGAKLYLTNLEGEPLLACEELDPELRSELRESLVSRDLERLPAALRFHDGESGTLALPIPSVSPALLVVVAPVSPPDVVVLQHVATLAALQIEQRAHQSEIISRAASDLLLKLIQRSIDTGTAAAEMRMLGLDPDETMLLAVFRDDSLLTGLHTLRARSPLHMSCTYGVDAVVLMEDSDEGVTTLSKVLPTTTIGVSASFGGLHRVPDALAEAQWARSASDTAGINRYGHSEDPLQPRTVAEAHRIVREVLGPLHEYDEAKQSELVQTLRVFLRSNRSWQQSIRELHIHRQTLVYRVKRIEEILGVRLESMDALARLWLACRALDVIEAWQGDAREEP